MGPPVLIGYFPKRVAQRPDWLKAPRVAAIRSVSDCISAGPPGWIQHWTHNQMWAYPTVAAARAVVPAGAGDAYEVHAYRMLPARWERGQSIAIDLPAVAVEPLPQEFERLGFDAVSMQWAGGMFECSPLSCNSMAEQIQTNEHCLLPSQAEAEQVALRFSSEEPEPGPYYVVEVWRRSEG